MKQPTLIKQGFFRVSLKAIIRNEAGEVLVVKEKGSSWSLPGGGLDHGEDVKTGLARELHEEVLLTGDFSARLVACMPMYVEDKQAYQMWMVFEVSPETMTFGLGKDADEYAFVNPKIFQDSPHRSERWVYKFAYEKDYVL